MLQGFGGGDVKEGDVDWRIILKQIFKKWVGGMDWIDLAPDRNGWRAVLNAVMNLEVPKNTRNFLTS